MKSDEELSLKVDQARWWMLRENPFYGQLAMGLADHIGKNKGPKKVVTNGKAIFWDKEYLSTLSDEEIRYDLCRMALHMGHLHPWRLPHDEKGNKAGAYALEMVMRDIKNIKRPDDNPVCPKQYEKLAEEEIYKLIEEQDGDDNGSKKGKGGGKGKDPCQFTGPGQNSEGDGDSEDGDGEGEGQEPTQEQIEQMKNDWEQRVIQATQAAQLSAGNVPADAQRLLERMRHQAVDWRRETADFIKDRIAHTNDWSRSARRHAWQKVIYPRKKQNDTGLIISFRDTSGSISNEICSTFTALITNCLADTNCSGMVADIDTIIHAEYWIEPGGECPLIGKGGGGTDFRAAMDRVKKIIDKGDKVAGVLFLTDMCTCSYGDDPGVPVLWLSTMKEGFQPPPFGRVVHIEV